MNAPPGAYYTRIYIGCGLWKWHRYPLPQLPAIIAARRAWTQK
jgi:hypothetical protein